MTQPVPNSNSINQCRHHTASGRRCRLPVQDSDSGFCFRHGGLLAEAARSADLSADLLGGLSEFSCAADLNKVLSQLLLLLASNRIALRRAAVIAYVTNQLLSTVREINREAKDAPLQIICDIPRPIRD